MPKPKLPKDMNPTERKNWMDTKRKYFDKTKAMQYEQSGGNPKFAPRKTRKAK